MLRREVLWSAVGISTKLLGTVVQGSMLPARQGDPSQFASEPPTQLAQQQWQGPAAPRDLEVAGQQPGIASKPVVGQGHAGAILTDEFTSLPKLPSTVAGGRQPPWRAGQQRAFPLLAL